MSPNLLSMNRNPWFSKREVVSPRLWCLKIPNNNGRRPTRGSSVFEDEMTVISLLIRSVTPRGSPSSVMSRRIVFRLSAPIPRSTQQHFRNANAVVFYAQPVTTVSDNEDDDDDDDLRPGDRLCTPANRYTFYALRLVCRFRSFRVARSIMWACLPFGKLPVDEILFLC